MVIYAYAKQIDGMTSLHYNIKILLFLARDSVIYNDC